MPAATITKRARYTTEAGLRILAETLVDNLRLETHDGFLPASSAATVPLVLEDLKATTPHVDCDGIRMYITG